MLRHPPTLPTAHAALYCITWQVRLPEHPSDQKISNARRYFPPPYPYLTPVAIMAAVAVSSPAVCPDATWAEQIKKLDDEVVTFEFEPRGSNSTRVRTWRFERGSNSNRVLTWRFERGSNSIRPQGGVLTGQKRGLNTMKIDFPVLRPPLGGGGS